MISKAVHENHCNGKVKKSLCDFFLPGNLMYCLELSNIYLTKLGEMGKKKRAGFLKHVLVQFS
jgi:hypothetical protein